ncbi:MFS transporter [Fusibacter sp. JL216-2]|uniref:MFS transporter n=1 Tax=Fusibacter sp. JL216-2 TaxID=3071453 RepID=UPI003D344C23
MNNNRTKFSLPLVYKLLLTQSISLIGTRMTFIALGMWLYQTRGQTMDLLLIPVFNELPSLLFGQVIGTFVDRLKKKTVLILSDLGQVIGTVLLLYAIQKGVFHTGLLYTVVFIQGFFIAGQEPAADKAIGQLTNSKNRTRVNGLKELTFPAAGVLAPVLGGLLYVGLGISGVLLVDFASFLVSGLIVAMLEIPEKEPTKYGRLYQGGFFDQLKAGMGFLRDNKGLLWMVVFMGLFNFLVNGPLELVIPFILETSGSEKTVSAMLSIMGMATALSSLILSSVVLPKRRMSLLSKAMVLTGLGLVVFGMGRNVFALGGVLFVLMLPLPLINVIFRTTLQEKVPSDIQGRVFATAYQLAYGTAPLSFLLAGFLSDKVLQPFLLANQKHLMGQIVTNYFVSYKSASIGIPIIGAGACIIGSSLVLSRMKAIRNIEDGLKTFNK